MTIKRSNIKVKLPEGYLKYRKESGLTHDMLLQKLWTNYRKGGTFSEEDQKVLEAAVKKSGFQEEEIIRLGSLSFAKKLTLSGKKSQHQYTKESTSRAERVIRKIMLANEKATHWWEKTYITPYSIKDYISSHQSDLGFKVVNHSTLSRSVIEFRIEIERHHAKHHLEDGHNRRASIERMKRHRKARKHGKV